MQIEPISYIHLVKQCGAGQASQGTLIDWLNLANTLDIQTIGSAISANLIKCLKARFNPVMTAIASLDAEPGNQAACEKILKQTSQFYEWLNGISGESTEQIETAWKDWFPIMQADSTEETALPKLDEQPDSSTNADTSATVAAELAEACQAATTDEFNKYD